MWIPFITHGTPRVAAGSHLRKRLLGTIRRPDGQLQVTYNHHPLYSPPHDRDYCPSTLNQFGGKFAYIDVSGEPALDCAGPY